MHFQSLLFCNIIFSSCPPISTTTPSLSPSLPPPVSSSKMTSYSELKPIQYSGLICCFLFHFRQAGLSSPRLRSPIRQVPVRGVPVREDAVPRERGGQLRPPHRLPGRGVLALRRDGAQPGHRQRRLARPRQLPQTPALRLPPASKRRQGRGHGKLDLQLPPASKCRQGRCHGKLETPTCACNSRLHQSVDKAEVTVSRTLQLPTASKRRLGRGHGKSHTPTPDCIKASTRPRSR